MNKSYTDILCTRAVSQRERESSYRTRHCHSEYTLSQNKNITNYGLLFYVMPVNVAPISTNVCVDKTILSIIWLPLLIKHAYAYAPVLDALEIGK